MELYVCDGTDIIALETDVTKEKYGYYLNKAMQDTDFNVWGNWECFVVVAVQGEVGEVGKWLLTRLMFKEVYGTKDPSS